MFGCSLFNEFQWQGSFSHAFSHEDDKSKKRLNFFIRWRLPTKSTGVLYITRCATASPTLVHSAFADFVTETVCLCFVKTNVFYLKCAQKRVLASFQRHSAHVSIQTRVRKFVPLHPYKTDGSLQTYIRRVICASTYVYIHLLFVTFCKRKCELRPVNN